MKRMTQTWRNAFVALTLLIAPLGTTSAYASPASDVEKYLSGLASWSADFE
jgi:hypothetical protein